MAVFPVRSGTGSGHVASDPDKGIFVMARVLDAIAEIVKDVDGDAPTDQRPVLDGGLIAFESVATEAREPIVEGLRSRGLAKAAAPDGFVHAMRMYPGAPGTWLTEVSAPGDLHVDPAEAERYLAQAVAAIFDGRSPGATAVKTSVFRQFITSGRLKFARNTVPEDELRRYPNAVTPEERGMVESFIRASFGALAGIDEEDAARRGTWATRFWQSNWSLFVCRRAGPEPATDAEAKKDAEERVSPELDEIGERIGTIWEQFLQAAITSDPGLYDPSRHEVLSGLAARGIRMAFVVATDPALWSGEFGASMLRSVAEIQIILAWLGSAAGDDPEIYGRFKDFGRGHLKLAKLHAEDIADRDVSQPFWDDLLETLDEEVNQETLEEFQDISLEGTFSGIDMRKMAIAAGAEDLYRLAYAPLSAIAHSEWPMLIRYSMEPCVNPLHAFHWLPRQDLHPALRPMAGEAAVVMAGQLLQTYQALVAPRTASGVDSAPHDPQ